MLSGNLQLHRTPQQRNDDSKPRCHLKGREIICLQCLLADRQIKPGQRWQAKQQMRMTPWKLTLNVQ